MYPNLQWPCVCFMQLLGFVYDVTSSCPGSHGCLRDMCAAFPRAMLVPAVLLVTCVPHFPVPRDARDPCARHPKHGFANMTALKVGIRMLHAAHAAVCPAGGVAPQMPANVMHNCSSALQCL